MASALTERVSGAAAVAPTVRTVGLDAWFGSIHAIRGVSLEAHERQVTAIIGPSGCGKSTLLRCLNRMHETIPGARVRGDVWLAGQNIYAPGTNAIRVRRLVGMVFQRPTPFPTMSIRAVGTSSFILLKHRMNVDFPQPDGPMIDVIRFR